MKKTISFVCALVMIMAIFTGCSGNNSAADGVDLSKILKEVNSSYDITQCSSVTNKEDLELYYGISPDDVKQFAAEYVSNNSTEPIEIVFVEAVNAEATDRVKLALENRFNSQSAQSKSYSADAHLIFEKCSVRTKGNFVDMIVSQHVDGIKSLYDSYVK